MRSELYEANQDLSLHARQLSSEIATKQGQVATALSEAAEMQQRFERAQKNLKTAQSAITIAERRLWDSLETIRDGFAVFDPDDWSYKIIDSGGMAAEDLTVADLNEDGKPDIIASGRATHNVKIYWQKR